MRRGEWHLPGDVLGLDEFARNVLAQRPHPIAFGGQNGLPVPARVAECSPPHAITNPALLDRDDLAQRLRLHLDVDTLHPAVGASIDKLADPRGLCVAASVPAGFLGGPLATMLAALHTVVLARELEQAWARPVAPVLWIRSDEHDVEAVRSAWFVNEHFELSRTALSALAPGRKPLHSIALDPDTHHLAAIASHLEQNLPKGPHRAAAIALFVPRGGETLGLALRRVFGALLGHLGLVCIEPFAIRDTLSRALAHLVDAGDETRLASARARLADNGPTNAGLVFRHERRQREPLHLVGKHFLFDGEEGERTGVELAAEIVTAPQRFSAGELLEPIARDVVLPVAAIVGDWRDARLAAAGLEWRAAIDAPRPAFVPRVGATLTTHALRTALVKRGVDLETLLRLRGELPPAPVVDRPAVLDTLQATVQRHATELKSLRADLAQVENGLAHHLKRAADENADRINKILARAERVHHNHAGTTKRHERRLVNALCPRGTAQVDVLATVQFAATHGTAWIDELAGALDPWPSEHLVFELQ